MKKATCIITFIILVLTSTIAWGGHGHYNLGVGGIKSATLPPPGMYYKMYNVWYTANHNRYEGRKKNEDFSLDVFAVANRFIKSWEGEVLGGNIVSNLIVTLVYTDISNSGRFSDNMWGMSDVYFEPAALAWHGENWDALFGVGVYLPVGYTDKDRAASPGKHFWTVQANAGLTYYFDNPKTWSFSAVARYEAHTEEHRSGRTKGNDFHVEWGLGKSLGEGWELGLAGYTAWQPTRDRGGDSTNDRYQAYSIGPEIQYSYKPWHVSVSLRSLYEFGVRNGTEGIVNCLSILVTF